jgi:hypothetical protein
MPFIPDHLQFRYAHLEDGDPTPGEMNQFEPCDHQSNDPNCPKCHGTGVKPHKIDLNIEGLDNPSSKSIDALTNGIRSDYEDFFDAMSRLEDHAKGMYNPFRNSTGIFDAYNKILRNIQDNRNTSNRGEDRGHIHGPQCSHDGVPDHGGFSRLVHQDEQRPYGYKGIEEHKQLHRQVLDMDKRIEQPMAQEEVDKQYNGNPAWLDRSRLGSWSKRYTDEG